MWLATHLRNGENRRKHIKCHPRGHRVSDDACSVEIWASVVVGIVFGTFVNPLDHLSRPLGR